MASDSSTTVKSPDAPTIENHRKSSGKRTTSYVLKSLLGGGIAGCAAKTVIAPMDRVKILFQTDNPRYIKYSGSFFGVFRAIRDIHGVYGVKGLFQGHSATLLRIFPYAAIKFMSYEQYKDWIMPRKEDETAFRRTLAGSLAGVSSLFVSYPLDLLRTRLAYEIRMPTPTATTQTTVSGKLPLSNSSPGLIETARMIYHEANPLSQHSKTLGGIANFYRGFVPTTYGMIPYAGVSFMCYESLKSWAVDQDGWWTYGSTKHRQGSLDEDGKSRQLTWWAQLTVGGLSGLIAQTASYPFEVIRRHMQIAGKIESLNGGSGTSSNGVKKFPSTLEMTRFIYRKRGFRGFFVGLSIGFMKVVPMHAVSFYVYEYMKVVLDF
ncbi:mitochondrial carrier domain-containing protein [Obelidium mucronatum]|nr:mitochondrial carrier domain-containing protein [Obelidium mucronatum]